LPITSDKITIGFENFRSDMQLALFQSLNKKVHYSTMIATPLLRSLIRLGDSFDKVLPGDAPFGRPLLGVRGNDKITWDAQARPRNRGRNRCDRASSFPPGTS
jgi:hypothetical protein